MAYHIVHRKWRVRKTMWYLFALELAGLVPLLVIFGISQPDLYRTKFWQIGFDKGFNSNPNMILYAYANHRPLPKIPFVWSQELTNFNVAISVISLFILLCKLICWIMKVWYPIVGTVFSAALVALYTTSVYGQMGPDYADERYPSPIAWYIRMSCDIAKPYKDERICMIAKGSFAVTIYMLALYVAYLGLAIWSMLPNKLDQATEDEEEDDEEAEREKQRSWEMRSLKSPLSPRSIPPYTPRTLAFRTLERTEAARYG